MRRRQEAYSLIGKGLSLCGMFQAGCEETLIVSAPPLRVSRGELKRYYLRTPTATWATYGHRRKRPSCASRNTTRGCVRNGRRFVVHSTQLAADVEHMYVPERSRRPAWESQGIGVRIRNFEIEGSPQPSPAAKHDGRGVEVDGGGRQTEPTGRWRLNIVKDKIATIAHTATTPRMIPKLI